MKFEPRSSATTRCRTWSTGGRAQVVLGERGTRRTSRTCPRAPSPSETVERSEGRANRRETAGSSMGVLRPSSYAREVAFRMLSLVVCFARDGEEEIGERWDKGCREVLTMQGASWRKLCGNGRRARVTRGYLRGEDVRWGERRRTSCLDEDGAQKGEALWLCQCLEKKGGGGQTVLRRGDPTRKKKEWTYEYECDHVHEPAYQRVSTYVDNKPKARAPGGEKGKERRVEQVRTTSTRRWQRKR